MADYDRPADIGDISRLVSLIEDSTPGQLRKTIELAEGIADAHETKPIRRTMFRELAKALRAILGSV